MEKMLQSFTIESIGLKYLSQGSVPSMCHCRTHHCHNRHVTRRHQQLTNEEQEDEDQQQPMEDENDDIQLQRMPSTPVGEAGQLHVLLEAATQLDNLVRAMPDLESRVDVRRVSLLIERMTLATGET